MTPFESSTRNVEGKPVGGAETTGTSSTIAIKKLARALDCGADDNSEIKKAVQKLEKY